MSQAGAYMPSCWQNASAVWETILIAYAQAASPLNLQMFSSACSRCKTLHIAAVRRLLCLMSGALACLQ